ncbi:50S ribosomal protein L21 [Patescibacteria group bacterium]|nr:50S ribosomal protein L21 [Patescibacteria group bacterium]
MTNKTENKIEKSTEKLAVIETGGKQYLVRPGDKIKIERLKKPEKGTTIVFDKVLLLAKNSDVKIGAPYLEGAKIKGEWLAEKKDKTVISMRYKSKTRQSRRQGHRQIHTEVIISDF